MASGIPHGKTLDADFMFTKLLVNDLAKASAFYTAVFGLVEMHRVEAAITGRSVTEVIYMPTSEGGPMFILAKFNDVSTPSKDELILGFATKDLEALLARVEEAGGSVAEPIQDVPQAGMRHAFIRDAEGHLIQVSQVMA